MKRVLSFLLVVLMLISMVTVFSGCESNRAKKLNRNDTQEEEKSDPVEDTKEADENTEVNTDKNVEVNTLADLRGKKIAAMTGTFHENALSQIPEVYGVDYPGFPEMLEALNRGKIDGFILEEPVAIEVCLEDDSLAYIPLRNNSTGFYTSDSDVGIAVGVRSESELRMQINEILQEISEETRLELMEQIVQLNCGVDIQEFVLVSDTPEVYTGTLRVGMECAYAPYNWTDEDVPTLGAVPISGEGKEGLYANGYDVQIAKYIANKLGMKLEIYAIEWGNLIPALVSGIVDGIIAGMSPTPEREEFIDFTDVYHTSHLVVMYKK